MIKAEELIKGSLVLLDYKPKKIRSIILDILSEDRYSIEFSDGFIATDEDIKEITLTEDIIINLLGFKKRDDDSILRRSLYKKRIIDSEGNRFYLSVVKYHDYSDDFTLHIDDCSFCTVGGGDIKTVHQLQMLVLSLTKTNLI